MADGINYTGDLLRYVLDRLFDSLTDKSYWNVDNRNNVYLLRIITRGSNSKFQLTVGVQGWKLTLARGELNSVRASGSSDLTSPVGEWEFFGDLSIISWSPA